MMEQTNKIIITRPNTLDSMCWRDCCVRVRESENVATTKNAIRNRDWYIERSSSFEQTSKELYLYRHASYSISAQEQTMMNAPAAPFQRWSVVKRENRARRIRTLPIRYGRCHRVQWKGECGDMVPTGINRSFFCRFTQFGPVVITREQSFRSRRFQWEYTREVKAVWFCHMQNAQ